MKALKDTVIKNREAVDCATLKDIEQKRCELVARAVVQLQKQIESDIEVAKGALMDVQRGAADVMLHPAGSDHCSVICSLRISCTADLEMGVRCMLVALRSLFTHK